MEGRAGLEPQPVVGEDVDRVGRDRTRPAGKRQLVVGVDLPVLSPAVVTKPGDMSHQLARRDPPMLVGQRREVVPHGRVQVEESPIEKQADGGRGEGLGHTADAEAHPWSQRDALLEIRPPQRLGPRELAIDGHRDRHARQVLVDDQVPRMLLDLLCRGGVSGRGRRKGLREQRPRVLARARGQATAGED